MAEALLSAHPARNWAQTAMQLRHPVQNSGLIFTRSAIANGYSGDTARSFFTVSTMISAALLISASVLP